MTREHGWLQRELQAVRADIESLPDWLVPVRSKPQRAFYDHAETTTTPKHLLPEEGGA